jgi:iron(III) transport system permease protein
VTATLAPPPAPTEEARADVVPRGRNRPLDRIRGVGVVLLVGSAALVPLLLLFVNSFNTARPGQPAAYGLDNWRRALADDDLMESLGNTLRLGVTRTAIALVIAVTLSLLIARTDMPGRKFVEVSLWFAFFVPSLSMTLGWILMLDPSNGLINDLLRNLFGSTATSGPLNIYGFWGIILAHISASTVPIMTILMIPAMRRMSTSLEEAARTCGAGRLRTLWYATLPLMKPAILGAALLSFIYSLKAFEIEYLLGNPVGFRVYSTQIYDWIYREPPLYGIATALGILIVPVMVVLAIGQRLATRERSFVTVGARNYSDVPMSLGPVRRWVIGGCTWLYVLVTIGVPMGALIVGSFMRRFGFFGIDEPFSAEHWSGLLDSTLFASSAVNSLKLGLGATVVGIIVYFAIALVVVRSKLPGRGTVDIMAWLPVTLPGILLGLGLLWLYLGTPLRTVLYGSVAGLVIALVINHMATGTVQMKAGIAQISAEHEQAARTCGAKPIRSMWSIMIPLIGPTVAGVAILCFDNAIRDISSVVLLSSGNSRPLSILLFEYSASGALEQAAALGVIMSVVTLAFGLIATKSVGGRLQRGPRRFRRGRRSDPTDQDAPDSVPAGASSGLGPTGRSDPPGDSS